jgi:radical SAM protein with 4Fe4S-binding SPASM domain
LLCPRVHLAEELAVALPEEVQIEPTGPGKHGPGQSPAFMCFDTFRRLLDQFAGARVLRLQGAGEPLAHPRFFDMVRYAVTRGMQVSALTALPPLTPGRAEECAKSGLQYLDLLAPAAGSAPAIFWRTVAHLQKAKKTLGAVTPWLRLAVPSEAIDEIAPALRLARERGLDGVCVQHLPGARAGKRSCSTQFFSHEIAEAAALADELGVRLDLPERSEPGCDAPTRCAYINYYGRARPCPMVTAADRLSFGNMSRDGAVRVWNSDAYREFRARLASEAPPAVCRGCVAYRAGSGPEL